MKQRGNSDDIQFEFPFFNLNAKKFHTKALRHEVIVILFDFMSSCENRENVNTRKRK